MTIAKADRERSARLVRDFRNLIGLSQTQLAELWGVGQGNVSQIERGTVPLRLGPIQLARTSEVLDMHLSTILHALGYPILPEEVTETIGQWIDRGGAARLFTIYERAKPDNPITVPHDKNAVEPTERDDPSPDQRANVGYSLVGPLSTFTLSALDAPDYWPALPRAHYNPKALARPRRRRAQPAANSP